MGGGSWKWSENERMLEAHRLSKNSNNDDKQCIGDVGEVGSESTQRKMTLEGDHTNDSSQYFTFQRYNPILGIALYHGTTYIYNLFSFYNLLHFKKKRKKKIGKKKYRGL